MVFGKVALLGGWAAVGTLLSVSTASAIPLTTWNFTCEAAGQSNCTSNNANDLALRLLGNTQTFLATDAVHNLTASAWSYGSSTATPRNLVLVDTTAGAVDVWNLGDCSINNTGTNGCRTNPSLSGDLPQIDNGPLDEFVALDLNTNAWSARQVVLSDVTNLEGTANDDEWYIYGSNTAPGAGWFGATLLVSGRAGTETTDTFGMVSETYSNSLLTLNFNEAIAGLHPFRYIYVGTNANTHNNENEDGEDHFYLRSFSGQVQNVPEPGTLGLLSLGFAGLGVIARRRRAA